MRSRLERANVALERFLDHRLTPLGVWVMRRTRGEIARPWNVEALLLTTRGRRSGRDRTVVLRYFPDGDAMIIAAANDGGRSHPGWYHNLVARPAATVEVGGRTIAVRAELLPEREAAAWWQRIVEIQPSYARFARATRRAFPIVRLRPATSEPGALTGAPSVLAGQGGGGPAEGDSATLSAANGRRPAARVLGRVLLGLSGSGYALSQLAIRRGGRRGALLVEGVCGGLLARDVALLAMGAPGRLRRGPAVLLGLETAAAAGAVVAGIRPIVSAEARAAATARRPARLELVRRAAVGALFALHTIRYRIYLSPDRGARLPAG